MRGLRLDRLTNRPYCVASALKRASRGDKIRTCGLSVPNAALYQTEPRLELFPQCFDSILDSPALVNNNLKRKRKLRRRIHKPRRRGYPLSFRFLSASFPRIVRYAVKGAAVLRIALYTGYAGHQDVKKPRACLSWQVRGLSSIHNKTHFTTRFTILFGT